MSAHDGIRGSVLRGLAEASPSASRRAQLIAAALGALTGICAALVLLG